MDYFSFFTILSHTSDAQLNLTNVSQQAREMQWKIIVKYIFVIMVFVFSVATPTLTLTHANKHTCEHIPKWCILSTIISILISCHLIIHIISSDFVYDASQKIKNLGHQLCDETLWLISYLCWECNKKSTLLIVIISRKYSYGVLSYKYDGDISKQISKKIEFFMILPGRIRIGLHHVVLLSRLWVV